MDGPFRGILELLQIELLRSIYEGFDQADAEARRRRRLPLDAEALLRMPTFFGWRRAPWLGFDSRQPLISLLSSWRTVALYAHLPLP